MKLYSFYRSSLLLVLTAFYFTAAMAVSDWIEIGTKRAGVSAKSVIFHIHQARSFEKIRFKISDGDLQLRDTKLYFSDKKVRREGLQRKIAKDSYSRSIPIDASQDRHLVKVEVFYTKPQQSTPETEAHISLMAMPARNPN